MKSPIQSIVDVYVRFGNRKGLDDLRAHRGGLIRDLWAVMRGPYDVSGAIAELENDIAVIEVGITNLNSSVMSVDQSCAWPPPSIASFASRSRLSLKTLPSGP